MMKMTGYLGSIVAILAVLLSTGVQSRFTSETVKCSLLKSTIQYCYVPEATSADKLELSLVADVSKSDGQCAIGSYRLKTLEKLVFIELTSFGCSAYFRVSKVDPPTKPTAAPEDKKKCGVNNAKATFRIVGGSYASSCKEYPWMVYLQSISIDRRTVSSCGGSIIDENHILTAAHCVVEGKYILPTSHISVYAGSVNKNSGTVLGTQKVFLNKYDIYQSHNDIAILRLRTSIRFDDCQSPICLTSDTTITPGKKCRVMGWGYTSPRNKYSPNWLKWIDDPMASSRDCQNKYGYIFDKQSVCGSVTSFCSGDSGGPYVCLNSDNKYYQYGIVSLHLTRSLCSGSGKYTHVPVHKAWIDQVLKSP